MNAPFDPIPDRRAIIDPRKLGDQIHGTSSAKAAKLLCKALEAGRKEIAKRLGAFEAL